MEQTPYPLHEKWTEIERTLARSPVPPPTGITRETYLDAAERIVRALARWTDEDGVLHDPFSPDAFYVANRRGKKVLVHAQTRFVGALGHLISAGRCADLVDLCIQAYEERLDHLDQVEYAPEFWVKELMFAHQALKDRAAPTRVANWEARWRAHDPRQGYLALVGGFHHHNFAVFALTGEFFKGRLGLGGDQDLVEEAITYLAQDFTSYGMYRDPHDPMAYDLVVKQQLDLVRHHGYVGAHQAWLAETCRRGALTSLLCQSVTGEMPFGGRSNQFNFVEGHLACLCETQACRYKQLGDLVKAGAFKRAGRRAMQSTLPWIADMEPFRHTKQGFHPSLGHGVDSAGPYSVYGALAASLFATAYHLADEEIEERPTPAELGGYVFELWPGFHKVFATCGGYHVEVDTRADPEKDATGLGRIHHIGARPEAALSGSISASATYSFGVERPQRSLAVGPTWSDGEGKERRLAEISAGIEDVRLRTIAESPLEVCFEIAYRGDLYGVREIVEDYGLSPEGLRYAVHLSPEPQRASLLVPVIHTDGQESSRVSANPSRLDVTYRGQVTQIRAAPGAQLVLTTDPPAANRNALYRTCRVDNTEVHIRLTREGAS